MAASTSSPMLPRPLPHDSSSVPVPEPTDVPNGPNLFVEARLARLQNKETLGNVVHSHEDLAAAELEMQQRQDEPEAARQVDEP